MKKNMFSDELKMEVVVGAFMVMVFLGLGYFTIILSREKWFGKQYRIEVVFQNVMGLRDGDNVVVRGMPVGKVKSLALKPDGVHVHANLDQELGIREGYRMTVVSTSVLGGRYLQVDAGPDGGKRLPGDTLFRGQEPYDLMADAAEVINEIKRGLISGGVVSNVQSMAGQLNEIASRLNAGKGTLGKLLSEDDTLYKDLSAGVASLKNIAERVDRGEGTLGKLLSKDDALYQDLSNTVSSLKVVAQKMERGEGTMGKLMNDGALYDDVRKAVEEVRAAIDDYRETAPVATFTSIFFGAF